MPPILTLDQKRQRWAGANRALDFVFSGGANGLLDGVMRDLSPVNANGNPKNPRFSIAGVGIGSAFKSLGRVVGFAFSHPVHAINLVRAARSLGDKDFQTALIGNEKLWGFLKEGIADRLPQIGKILGGFGVKLFQKGNIL